MQTVFPDFAEFEEVILQVGLDRFGPHIRSAKNLAPAILELSDFYNAAAGERGTCPDNTYHQAARLLFFTLADMPKAYAVATEAALLHVLPQTPKLKILDLGAGYGAQSLGVLACLFQTERQRRVVLDLVDKDAGALDACEQVFEQAQNVQLLGDVVLNRRRADLNQNFHPGDRYDIIILGNTLCELQAAVHYPLLKNLLAALTEGGVLLVIEPALKTTARTLHQLRDRLLAEQQGYMLAPCTRQANCPCLENDKDWCHEARRIVLPPRARQLAAATGLRLHEVKWAYMTLTRACPSDFDAGQPAWRVVSGLLKPKGKQEIFVCGPQGRLRAVLQKRAKSPANKPFKKLQRGQYVQIDNATLKNDMLLLEPGSVVQERL